MLSVFVPTVICTGCVWAQSTHTHTHSLRMCFVCWDTPNGLHHTSSCSLALSWWESSPRWDSIQLKNTLRASLGSLPPLLCKKWLDSFTHCSEQLAFIFVWGQFVSVGAFVGFSMFQCTLRPIPTGPAGAFISPVDCDSGQKIQSSSDVGNYWSPQMCVCM
jgi:hypothetical protein